MSVGRVVAVCTSERTGIPKRDVGWGSLRADWGLEGDAHAGPWHRQVSLLAIESIEKMRAMGLNVRPGSFAENITTEGLELYALPLGTRIRLGSALVEVTQIGKVCHDRCAIYAQAGDCVMPREGIFVRVIEPGEVKTDDAIERLDPAAGETPEALAAVRGEVVAVSLSEKRGTSKHPVDQVELLAEWGVEGDAHAGHWHRQVSMLGVESIEAAVRRGVEVGPGSFAENIATKGVTLYELPLGTLLQVGEALVQVTQIGKHETEPSSIQVLIGDSAIPREGIFVRVLQSGVVRGGDAVAVVPFLAMGEGS